MVDTVQQVYANDHDHPVHLTRNQTISKVRFNLINGANIFDFWLIFNIDYHQNYQQLNARRGQGRILPATPNKPSALQIPQSDVHFLDLESSPTRVSCKLFAC